MFKIRQIKLHIKKILSKFLFKRAYRRIFNFKNLPSPRSACIFLTMKCNLKCKMCWQKEIRQTCQNELTTKEIKTIVDKLKEINTRNISLTGGEPLLRLDTFEIIDYILNKGMKVALSTNGTLFNDEKIERLKGKNVDVCLSLEGLNEINDGIRGKGSFKRVIELIDKLTKRGTDVTINMTIQDSNILHVKPFVEFFRKFYPGIYLSFGFEISDKRNFSLEIYKKFIETIKYLKINVSDLIDFTNPEEFYFKKYKAMCSMINQILINSNGDIILCGFIREPIGNAIKDDLKLIWNSEKMKKLRYENGILLKSSICRNCCNLTKI